ncbi:hypothetical protein PAPYR_5582 [Paratrimastix pyriformis]|uniref:Uncharacterized protein n=1 Tax=Paratrimastix pyriformis TaxID=342808 RepID=A0ABQ8UL02_9EUKA|nr:hypothetical protein PAPYR_5582 [Paratrimastix pyriformis]
MNTEVFSSPNSPLRLTDSQDAPAELVEQNDIQTRPASFPPAPLESEPSGTASTCTEIAHALAQSASSETISAHGCDVHSRMNSPVAAPRHAARCPDRGERPGGVQFPGAPDDLQDDPATPPLARATDRGAEVEPLPPGDLPVQSLGRPVDWAPLLDVLAAPELRQLAASLGKEDWFGEEPSDSTKKTLVPALARALEGSPGDVTLELVIRWACPGGAAPETRAHLQELLASQAPAERHMTTPPQTPPGSDPSGASSVSAGLLWSSPTPPGDARVASSAFAEPSACTSSQARGYSGISRYRGPPAVPVPAAVPVAPAAPAAPTAAPTAVPTAAPAAPAGPSRAAPPPVAWSLAPLPAVGSTPPPASGAPAEPKVPAPSVRAAALAPQPPFAWVTYAVPICELPRGLAKSPVARGAPSPVELVIGQVLGLVSGLLKALGRHLPRVEDPDVFDTVAALAMELRRLPVDDLPIDLARTLRSLLLAFGPASGAVSNEPAVGPSVGGSAPVTGGPAPGGPAPVPAGPVIFTAAESVVNPARAVGVPVPPGPVHAVTSRPAAQEAPRRAAEKQMTVFLRRRGETLWQEALAQLPEAPSETRYGQQGLEGRFCFVDLSYEAGKRLLANPPPGLHADRARPRRVEAETRGEAQAQPLSEVRRPETGRGHAGASTKNVVAAPVDDDPVVIATGPVVLDDEDDGGMAPVAPAGEPAQRRKPQRAGKQPAGTAPGVTAPVKRQGGERRRRLQNEAPQGLIQLLPDGRFAWVEPAEAIVGEAIVGEAGEAGEDPSSKSLSSPPQARAMRLLRVDEWPARVPAVLGALAADAARAACAACAACTAWPLSAFAGLAGLWAFVSAACVVFRAVRFPDGPVDAFCCSACLAGRTPGGAPCGAPGTRSLPASGRFAGWPIARLAGAISTAAGAMER